MESDFYKDSDYTADISTKMRVPDRLTAHGGVPGAVSTSWLSLNVGKGWIILFKLECLKRRKMLQIGNLL